ncbi:hypothetical protein [Sphingobium sp. CFD-2]|uniref:hypothetical protein n=1 Tax=Sphingobium sp. CFD-2 TaxID=2878542 RepID=UPI00214C1C7A|nr:hypothetical protein [Sphingobium sp. CFD-2]
MHIDPARAFKAASPRFIVVLDGEFTYDTAAHARYQATERFAPNDRPTGKPADASNDPRVTPRWPFLRLVTLSWLVLSDAGDGLRPLRLESRGLPEQDEAAILTAFFNDMQQLGAVELVTWGGFHVDLPRMLMSAMTLGLRIPDALKGLLSPWRRHESGHRDLMSEVCAGAGPVHLAEVAARLSIPVKTVCRADLVSRLMEHGKWSSVRAVAEGDTLTTCMVLMLWRHMAGEGASALEAKMRLATFIAENCAHRPYHRDWLAYRDDALRIAFATETARMGALAPAI